MTSVSRPRFGSSPRCVREGAQVIACDPVAIPAVRLALDEKNIQYAQSLTEAIEGVDAIVLLTAWPEFLQLPDLLEDLTESPVVIDGRRAFEKARLRRYEGIGLRSSRSHVIQAFDRRRSRS